MTTTISTLAPTDPARLPDAELVAEIAEEHAAAVAAASKALSHARRAGELLVEAKGRVPHGSWGPWLEEHFPASGRTARLYMSIAERWDELPAGGENGNALPIRAAARLLAKSRETEVENGDGLAAALEEAMAETARLLANWRADLEEECAATYQMPKERQLRTLHGMALDPTNSRTLRAVAAAREREREAAERIYESLSQWIGIPVDELRTWPPREWAELRAGCEQRIAELEVTH